MSERLFIASEEAMLALGAQIAEQTEAGDVIFLQGELGAGKTTLARGFLHALGIQEKIKSPTFTLVEEYSLDDKVIFHFDLYRLETPEALNDIGLSDYLNEDAICLIEWPEKAGNILPKASCCCKIQIPDSGEGRWVTREV